MPKRLPRKSKRALEKALDSALLAVEIYNKPAIKFKSGGFISLMVIAWTAFFHAIFFKRKIKPYYKEDNDWFYQKRDGDYVYWELKRCLKEYFGSDTGNPVRKNLEFFIPLRNMVEHKSFPEIDPDIFGECQSMLLNFDEMIEKEFGESYCIRESLSFSLQLYPSSKSLSDAIKSNPGSEKTVEFIRKYRSSITTDVLESGKYSFKAFLIQVANHESKEALPIQFVNYEKLSDKEKGTIKRIASLVKYKYKKIPVANPDYFRPSVVVNLVQKKLGDPKIIRYGEEKDKFNMSAHTRCWKKYGVRPTNNSKHPEKTQTEYCIYDENHNDYLYSEVWVDFLVEKMNDEDEYASLYKTQPD